MSWRFLLCVAISCGGAPARPAISAGAIPVNKTFLLRHVERVRVGTHEKKRVFAAEETFAEGSGTVATAIKLNVLEGEATGHRVVRARGDGVEVFDPAGKPVPDEAIIATLYRFVGKPDPFRANAPAAHYDQAISEYLTGTEALFQSVEKTRSRVLAVRDDVVTIHVELAATHRDKECTWQSTPRGTLTLRRNGGDLAHLEMKGTLAGKCAAADVEGDLELIVDRAPR